jgi:toxin ParE1/3/4
LSIVAKAEFQGFDIRELWRHAIGVAMIVSVLDRQTGGHCQEDVFTAGIIHDIGKIVMVCHFRDLFQATRKAIAQKEIDLLETACESLSQNPERGSIPRELEVIGTFEYRQIIHKKFRIIYQVSESVVFIFGILHGRRNVSEISSQKLR